MSRPHVTQNDTRRGGSAIDARTTRHAGYAKSQHARPRIERAFGWLKTIAWMRKVKLRGLAKVDWLFVFASAAFNLIRLPEVAPGVARDGRRGRRRARPGSPTHACDATRTRSTDRISVHT